MSPAATVASPARTRSRPQTAPRRNAPPRRHLRSVPAPASPRRATRRRLRPQAALMMAIVVFVGVLFGVALLQTVLVQGQIRLDGLRADLSERQATAQELRAEVGRLGSPQNIVAGAVAQGMVVPTDVSYIPTPPEETEGG
jgi:cell division protein FtsL